MAILSSPGSPAVPAFAKLNPFLEVLGRRADGYHDLSTVMVEVSLADRLVFGGGRVAPRDASPAVAAGASTAPTPHFDCRVHDWERVRPGEADADAPVGRDNLVVRALEALALASVAARRGDGGQGQVGQTGDASGGRYGGDGDGHAKVESLRVELFKRIPVGAGLGGGSADAAAVLRHANRVWNAGLDDAALTRLASSLGADMPFFLRGGWALCEGLGERVRPLPAPPGGPWCFWLFAPPWTVNTAAAYRALDESRGQHPGNGRVAISEWPDGDDSQGADGRGDGREGHGDAGDECVERADFAERDGDGFRSAGPFLRALAAGDRAAADAAAFNRFESVLSRLEPRQAAFQNAIRALGGSPARLTGSGSAVWCRRDDDGADAAEADASVERWRKNLKRAGWPNVRVWRVQAVTRSENRPTHQST